MGANIHVYFRIINIETMFNFMIIDAITNNYKINFIYCLSIIFININILLYLSDHRLLITQLSYIDF